MSADLPAPRTAGYVRRFDIWFGALFLGLGLVALVVGTAVYFPHVGDPEVLAYIAAPLGVAVIFSCIGGFCLVTGLRQKRKEERLLQSGTTVEAQVRSVERTGARVNRRYLWRVRYVYQDYAGLNHEGDSGYLSAEEARTYSIGEQVYIRYDPDQPNTSMWLGREQLP